MPASVTMAQAIVESAWGASQGAREDNNLFGIKCTSPGNPGPFATGCRLHGTEECLPTCGPTQGWFRVYATADDSFRDHGDFLRRNDRYAPAFRYQNDPDQFARELKKAGYATDPVYANTLISIMRDFDLYRFNSGGPEPVGPDGCTDRERAGHAGNGCGCVDHQPSGGFCPGTGCTSEEEARCDAAGQLCSLHECKRRPTTYLTQVGDFDGNGKSDVVTLSPNAGGSWSEWASVDLSNGRGFDSSVWTIGTTAHMRNGGPDASYRTVSGDFDGDGRSDLATLSPNGGGAWAEWAALELSTGSGFRSEVWPVGTAIHMRNDGGRSDYRVLTGDFNGDGKTDLATVSPNGGGGWGEWIALELSTGSGFTSATWRADTVVHLHNDGGRSDYRVLTGDFNGDGKTDLATVSPNGGGGWGEWVALELSTGSGFTSATWRADTAVHLHNDGGRSDYRVLTGDFNGDGKTDLATVSPNGGGGWGTWIAVELSTGSGFVSHTWPAETTVHAHNGGGTSYQIAAADVDADGKSDLVTFSALGGGAWADWMAVERSTGTGFVSEAWATPTPQHVRNGDPARSYRMLVGDYDGNHKADVALLSPDGGGAWAEWMSVDLSNGRGFDFGAWATPTPQHMRNGMR